MQIRAFQRPEQDPIKIPRSNLWLGLTFVLGESVWAWTLTAPDPCVQHSYELNLSIGIRVYGNFVMYVQEVLSIWI